MVACKRMRASGTRNGPRWMEGCLTSSPSLAKSADRIDGLTMMSFLGWVTLLAPALQTIDFLEAAAGLTLLDDTVFIANAI